METKIHTHSSKGAIRLGTFENNSADEPNCGKGTIAWGKNIKAVGEGNGGSGYSDRPGGIVVNGMGTFVNAVSLQNSTIKANGEG